jgi:ABC-type thiamine transport system ATPase subunit
MTQALQRKTGIPAMTTHQSAEISGGAEQCAQVIAALRREQPDLLIDERGYLLIPEKRWEAAQQLAAQYDCQFRRVEKSKAA